MAIIANNTKVSKANFKVALGTGTADTYTSNVTRWQFKTPQAVEQIMDVSGAVLSFVAAPQVTLDIGLYQDWSATGLATFLMTNRGAKGTITVEDANSTWTATVTFLMPAEIGGDTTKAPQTTLTLPVDGVPVKSAAV